MLMSGSNHRPGPAPQVKTTPAAATASGMRLITLFVLPYYLERLDDLVRAGMYPNRAEAIRFAIRDMTREEAL